MFFEDHLLGQTKNVHLRRETKAEGIFLRHIQTVCAWRHEFKERRQLRGVNEHNLVQIPTYNNNRNITDKSISLHLINARSVAGNAVFICEHISKNCVDILAITETWLREGEDCHTVTTSVLPGTNLLVCQYLRPMELKGEAWFCNQGKPRCHMYP